jgi:DNA repair protein RadD
VIQLRDYQERALAALYAHLREKDTNPCVVIPTGGGKTPFMAQVCKDAVAKWSGRVLILAHRRELLQQSYEKLGLICPDVEAGVYSAGLNRRNTDQDIIVAGIQSVFRRACTLGKFDLIMIDEAHRIPPDGEGMYREFLAEQKVINPFVRLIGLTATPYRMGTGPICAPENLLHEVCYEVGVKELIVDGWLCRLISKTAKPESIADTSDVHTRGGEFIESELQDAFCQDGGKVKRAVGELLEYAKETNRKKALVFTCGVTHARMVLAELAAQGVPGEQITYVDGETPSAVRHTALESFKDGSSPVRFMVNINVLTEGFDAPNIDLIALMRATKSPGLYYQMVGRGLRTLEGKPDCLVLDFGENILRHGPIDKVRPKKDPTDGTGEAPCKVCPSCQSVVPAAVSVCPDCGHVFPPKEDARHEPKASTESVLSMNAPTTDWYPVERVSYFAHEKRNAPPGHPKTLRVDYRISFYETFSEWVCVEHPVGSFPRQKAELWWRHRAGMHGTQGESAGLPQDPPRSAEEACALARRHALYGPSEIQVRKLHGPDNFPRIIGYRFSSSPPPVSCSPAAQEAEQHEQSDLAWEATAPAAVTAATTFDFGANLLERPMPAEFKPRYQGEMREWLDSLDPSEVPF